MKTENDPDEDDDDDTTPAGDTDQDGGTGVAGLAQQPYGAQLIAAYHGALSAANKKAEGGMGAMEHPEATPAMRGALDSVKDAMTALRGAHASCYPKSVLKDDMGDDSGDESDDDSDSEMKAWLAKGCNQLTLKGAAITLASLKSARNLTSSQRHLIAELAGNFDRWGSHAKSLRAKKPTNELTAEQQAAIDAAFAKLTAS
jgi:hypothetical protein